MENFSQLKTWNLKKKLAPKNTIEPPSAKRNSKGELTTDIEELKELYLETYKDRLTPNDVPEYLKDVEALKEILFDLRLENSKTNVTDDWTMRDLEQALKETKNNKARDPHGHVFELFKYGGTSLKRSLLNLCNLCKKMQIYPDILKLSNITSIHKNNKKKEG